MKKTPPPRPSENFRVTTFVWQLDNESAHAKAGSPKVPHEVLQRRFFQLLSFLQSRGMTVRIIALEINDIDTDTELRNSDLTDFGFRYIQRYFDRWASRMYKDAGAPKEQAFLEKWYLQLAAETSDA